MKNIIITLIFIGSTNFLSAQSTTLKKEVFELKPISLHLYAQKTPFTISHDPTAVQNVSNYIPVVKNHPFGDYAYNYLSPYGSANVGFVVAGGLLYRIEIKIRYIFLSVRQAFATLNLSV